MLTLMGYAVELLVGALFDPELWAHLLENADREAVDEDPLTNAAIASRATLVP